MIRFSNVSFGYRGGLERPPLFSEISLTLPGDRRIAILGPAHSGKTSILNLIAGLALPLEGRIERFARVSFPAGYQRGFKQKSTMRQNIEFAARVYGGDPREIAWFVGAVTELESRMDEPLADLSAHERITLSYALTYALPFDTYLFDNVVAFGLPAFRDRCNAMFEERGKSCGMIFATRNARLAAELCDFAIVLDEGTLRPFDDIQEAIRASREIAARTQAAKTTTAAFEESLPDIG